MICERGPKEMATEKNPSKPGRVVPMRVIVCGLHRTGTLSEYHTRASRFEHWGHWRLSLQARLLVTNPQAK
jgi:hypothetical protein